MNTRAQWAVGVTELYDGDLAKIKNYLTLAAVSEKTGLSPNTLKDALSRTPVTREDNPMYALSRPAARVSNMPMYSKEQVELALKIQRESGHRHLGGGKTKLETVTAEEAKRANLVSTMEIADFADVHEQTVRRWARDHGDFPQPVALRARSADRAKAHPGMPEVVREKEAVESWLKSYLESKNDKRTVATAEYMRRVHGWNVVAGSAMSVAS